MNWKKISIQRLRDYEARQQSLLSIPEQIETLEISFESIRAAKTDAIPIRESGNKREDSLINNIAMRDELKNNLQIVTREVEITKKGMANLTPDEKKILQRFYINRPRGHVELLSEELCMEKTRIYEMKEDALRKFTIACYGIVEI